MARFPHLVWPSVLLWLHLAGLPALAGPSERPLPPPEVPSTHQHPAGMAGPEEHIHVAPAPADTVGLQERLGEYIPLDVPFTDEQGKTVTLGELIDSPTIIAPVYYRCPNVCNFIQGALAQAAPEISLQPGEEFRIISLSFDETDTPELARRSRQTYYQATRDPEFPEEAWHFLTGDPQNIRRVTDALGYGFQRQGVDFLHPVAIAVVAPDGKIVRYLYGTRFLPMDLTLALVEGSQGKVGATVKRVLGFCFSYDAENRRYVFNLLRVSAVVVLLTLGSFLAFLLFGGKKKGKHGRDT